MKKSDFVPAGGRKFPKMNHLLRNLFDVKVTAYKHCLPDPGTTVKNKRKIIYFHTSLWYLIKVFKEAFLRYLKRSV